MLDIENILKNLAAQLEPIKPEEQFHYELLKDSWKNYVDAENAIKQDGKILKCQNGRFFINPLVNEKNECWKQILKLSNLFGLTPSPRTAVNSVDPLESLLNGQ